jgi:hypothetical protein
MTDREESRVEAAAPNSEFEISATQAVNQFGSDIKEAIADLAKSIPREDAEVVLTKRAVLWYAFTWFTTVVGAAGVAWLVAIYIPSHSAVQFTVRYGDTSVTCSRGPSTSDGHPLVVCVPNQ